jgi:SNF2 family DNA or RNA helicase
MHKFRTLLRAILLRRTKTSKIDGVDIVKGLPEKTTEVIHAVFDEKQLEFYRAREWGGRSDERV